VGSNAVVVRDVPAECTVVGIPGHIIRKDQRPVEHRQAIAAKIGFDAYGVTRGMPDPVATAVNCMLDHMHAMDKRMQELCEAVKRVGGELPEDEMPELDSCAIEPTSTDDPGTPQKIVD
jgi:serine O-acetyltransferase